MIEGMSGVDEAMMIDGPIAGEGLTQDPENPQPWETAPEYSNLEEFIDDMFLNITQEDNLDGILDPMRKGTPIDDIAQLLLFQAFSSGKISTDLMMSSIEPTVYMLIGLATFAEIEDPVLYPEDDMLGDDEDEISALEQAGKGQDVSLDKLPVPPGVSKSLVDKLKEGDI
jgi:hypothetical protein